MRFVFFLTLLLFSPAIATAANIYEVKNISVTLPSADVNTVRDKAMVEAQNKAFDQLQNNLVTAGYITAKQQVAPLRINNAVSTVDIISEKIGSKDYRASYDITFNGNEIARIFNIGVVQPTIDPEKYLIIPIILEKSAVKIWKNDWMKKWDGLKNDHIILPLGDLQDIKNLRNEDLAAQKYDGVIKMQNRYGANNIVIIQAEYLEPTNSLDVQLVKIKDRDRVAVNYEYPGDAGITKEDLFDAAANDLVYRLENDKLTDDSLVTSPSTQEIEPVQPPVALTPATTPPPQSQPPLLQPATEPAPTAAPAGVLGGSAARQLPVLIPQQQVSGGTPIQAASSNATVTAPDLIAWNRIRNKISAAQGVTNLQVKSFAAGQGHITFSHPADTAALKASFDAQGLELTGDGTNWVIREKL